MDILDLLRGDGSIVVNKKLAHKIGLQEAIIYSELVSLYKYWKMKNGLTADGYFYCTYENLEENTTIKEKAASRATNALVKLGLIEKVRRGLPSKVHYRITKKIYGFFQDWEEEPEEGNNEPGKNGQNGGTDNTSGLKGINEEEQGLNPRHDQIGQNDGSASVEMMELDRSKGRTNNTRTNNTRINNTKINNQSIRESVLELDLPDGLKSWLVKKEDRLTDDKLSIIQSFYKEDLLTEVQFKSLLSVIFSQKSIRKFKQYFEKSFYQKVEEVNQQPEPQDKSVQKGVSPDWLYQEEKEPKKFSPEEQKQAEKDFKAMIARSKIQSEQKVDAWLNE